MFKKLFIVLIVSLVVVSGFSLTSVFAKNDKNADIPEIDGIYDVPGHPEMKVRVFTHKAKPGPVPQPTLVCGLPDADSFALIGKTGWKLPSSWTYYINSGSMPSSINGSLAEIAAQSFKSWTDVANVTISNVGTTTVGRKGFDGKNIITWGTASGSALAVTYTWYYTSTGEVAEVDTIMNKKFTWTWSDPDVWTDPACAYSNSYDAQNILTHELGHWFGLNDHYTADYANATMFGYGSKQETKKDTLTTGDIYGIQAIY